MLTLFPSKATLPSSPVSVPFWAEAGIGGGINTECLWRDPVLPCGLLMATLCQTTSHEVQLHTRPTEKSWFLSQRVWPLRPSPDSVHVAMEVRQGGSRTFLGKIFLEHS